MDHPTWLAKQSNSRLSETNSQLSIRISNWTQREIQLAAQECGRKLAAHIRKRQHADYQAQRRSIFELYIHEVARAIGKIVGRSPDPIRREFLKVAERVTEADLASQDAKLEEAAEKTSRRPRRSEEDE